MFKKLFAISLLFLYVVASSGATAQLHYCCGMAKNIFHQTKAHTSAHTGKTTSCPLCKKLESSSTQDSPASCCENGMCSKKGGSTSCKSIVLTLPKTTEAHLNTAVAADSYAIFPAEICLFYLVTAFHTNFEEPTLRHFHTPVAQLRTEVPIFIKNCTYLI